MQGFDIEFLILSVEYQVKGISKEELEVRNDLVLALPERIQAIADGTMNAAKETGGWALLSAHKNVKFDSSGDFDALLLLEFCNGYERFNRLSMVMTFSNKLKNQANSSRNMKCGK